MTKKSIALGSALMVVLAAGTLHIGCATSQSAVRISEIAPPSPKAGEIYYVGQNSFVYVEGHYSRVGSGWTWVKSYWVEIRPGYVYQQDY